MKNTKLFLVVLAVLFLSVVAALSWSATGHRVIAALAFHQLSSKQRNKITSLLMSHPSYPEWERDFLRNPNFDFDLYILMRASSWPDEIRRSGGEESHPRWHYVDYSLKPPAFQFEPRPTPADDILYGIRQCEQMLERTNEPARVRAVYLSWLIHLIGDIHQPLHCSTLVNGTYETGDKGGNDFFIKSSEHALKLHAFWDNLLGTSDRPNSQLDYSVEIEASCPRESLQEIQNAKTPKWHVLDRRELESLVRKQLPANTDLYYSLKSKHFIQDADSQIAPELLTLKVRTKRHRVAEFTSLHMFVVTLRCNHSCHYCQVSRQSEDRSAFDMTTSMADKAIDFTFRSPSRSIKIEFQGGEPLLNFDLIKHIVLESKRRNVDGRRDLAFVIATNLSVLNDEILDFCREHEIFISTSLDGPEDLHNANRPNTGGNSYRAATDGINRARAALGHDRVSALMTTTKASLSRVSEIVDEYLSQGFTGIFLRALSPYGFAIKSKGFDEYSHEKWQEFYRQGLDYIIQLNKKGTFFVEHYASLILRKMLTPYGTGYVNLQSPAGIGIAGIVFNYNGEVYPSDEARMKAEMGDKIFRMGHLLSNTYEEMMLSPALLNPLQDSVAETVPMCEECAFLPYCGCDPDYHYATQHDFVGHKTLSGFCAKNMGIFRYLIQKMEDDAEVRAILENWVQW